MSAIRLARSDDLPRLHPLIERAYRGETARAGWTHEADLIEGPRTSLANLAAILDDPAERLLVAEQDQAIIGCVQISERGAGVAYLGLLAIEPALQNAGLGKQLLAAGETAARDIFAARTIEMTVIDVRTRLLAYYERRGYRRTGERRDFIFPADPPLFMAVLAKPLA